MKYVWIVSSHYQGENAQGNVLGAHGSKASGMGHCLDIREDRETRADIAWTATMARPDKFHEFQWEVCSFYVMGKRPEIVKLVRWAVTHRRTNEKPARNRSRK